MLVSTKSRTVQMIGSSCSGANGGAWSGATIAIGSPGRWDRDTARISRFCVGARPCMPNGNESIAAEAGAEGRVTGSSNGTWPFLDSPKEGGGEKGVLKQT